MKKIFLIGVLIGILISVGCECQAKGGGGGGGRSSGGGSRSFSGGGSKSGSSSAGKVSGAAKSYSSPATKSAPGGRGVSAPPATKVSSPKLTSAGIKPAASPTGQSNVRWNYHPTTGYSGMQASRFQSGPYMYGTNSDWMFWYLIYNSSRPHTVYVTQPSPTPGQPPVQVATEVKPVSCFACHSQHVDGKKQAFCQDCHFKHVDGKSAPKSTIDIMPEEAKKALTEESDSVKAL